VRKEINQKIIDLLEADDTLKKEVKEFIYGLPKKTPAGYPVIFVKAGEESKRLTNPSQYLYGFDFMIGITHVHVDEDEAEKKVQDLADRVENVLNANLTVVGFWADIVFGRGENAVAITNRGAFMVEGHYFVTCKKFVSRV